MRAVGLFAGIGGMELGFSSAGINTELLCEILPEARAVLKSRFDNVPIHSDINTLKKLPGNTSIVCAGFPCQDLSSAGPKGGIAGLRSSLIGEVFRLLEKNRPEWVLLENVKFMLHLQGGEAIKEISNALENLGYRWAYRVLNSQNFGVPQRRERVYLLASRTMQPAHVLFRDRVEQSPEIQLPTDISSTIGFYWTEGMYSTGLAHDALPPLKGGSTIGIPSAPAIYFPNGLVATPDIQDAEKIQGFLPGWTSPAENVTRPSFRWKLVGNAVTVNVCRWIAEGIANYEERDSIPLKKFQCLRWPTAACGEKGLKWTVLGDYGPFNRVALSSFLSYSPKPLSYKAITGFIGRARKGNLKYPIGFLDALERYAKQYD